MPLPQPGGGGAATFPVGPKNDGTNTYEINGAAGELFVTNLLDGDGNPAALVDLQAANATSRSALISSQRDDGSRTAALSVDGGVGSYALNADDGTNTYVTEGSAGGIQSLTIVEGTGENAEVGISAAIGSALAFMLADDNVGHLAQFEVDAAGGSARALVTLASVQTIISTPTTLTLAPATIPAADPHVAGQVYSLVGVLHISAG